MVNSLSSIQTLPAETPLVLIIDDSRAIRSFVKDLLQQAGYAVAEAVDGEEGLSAITALQPDVVLLDVEMPRKTGLEVLAGIDPLNRLFSVILFTTQSSLDAIVTGLYHGADDYIIKPFQEAELLARVAAALRISQSKRALAEARTAAEENAEKLRLAQQQLVNEERILAIARLSAGAAHQINNPLGFILSNLSSFGKYTNNLLAAIDDLTSGKGINPAEILNMRKISRIRADLPELLHETEQGLKRIALIVSGLGRLELGLSPQKRQVINMNSLVAPLIHFLEKELPTGTTLQWSPCEGSLPVLGHLALINTALSAVLDNAREAVNSPDGRIYIKTAQVDKLVQITIVNTTAGSMDENLMRAFEPFYSTKSPETHCGLGLTIAERFIASHNGTISLRPTNSREICATISLPLTTEPLPQ